MGWFLQLFQNQVDVYLKEEVDIKRKLDADYIEYFYKNLEENGYLYLMSIDEDYYPDNLLNGNYPFDYGALYIYYIDNKDNIDVVAGFWQHS